jgi:acyl-coenzyme A thioesterase PaaI-like protein
MTASGSPKNPGGPHASALGLRARTQNCCVVCGHENPYGLRIEYVREPDGAVSAEWLPTVNWEGFEGIVHGGIIGTVLDEAMSKSVAGMNCEALTGELRVRFRRHVGAGESLRIRGWVVEKVKRLVKTEATLTAADGSERAHAWASFLALPRQIPPSIKTRGIGHECRR